MLIGIYGGSFNPVHTGHTSLAQHLVDNGFVDEVWLLVSPLNPLKQDKGDIAPYSHRLNMAELACSACHGVKVSDFESTLPVPSYTITTLEALSKAYPEHQFAIIIGADNWNSFSLWYRHEDIISNHKIFIYNRPGYAIEPASLKRYDGQAQVIDAPTYDISSTEIRRQVKDGVCTSQWLSQDVLEYIRENKLYVL